MMFLFTKSGKIGSKAIRWALNEPVSHAAMVFDEREDGYGIVFHSHLSGVGFDWFRHFYDTHSIVYALRPKTMVLAEEEKLYQAVVSNFYGKPYDKIQFMEFGYYAIRQKLFNYAIPSKSRFGDKDSFLCTELVQKVYEAKAQLFSKPLEGDLITPYQLYKNMSESTAIEKVPWICGKTK